MSNHGYHGCINHIPVGIGQRIDQLCYERNISYSKLGEICGIQRKTMYSYIEGSTTNLEAMIKIADYFTVSLDWLILGRGNR